MKEIKKIKNLVCLFSILLGSFLLVTCDDNIGKIIDEENDIEENEIVDTMEPTPGDNGVINFNKIYTTKVVVVTSKVAVSWVKALDDVSMQINLQYQLYMSSSDNIENYGQAKKNGELLMGWTTNIDNFTTEELIVGDTYYFNVMVKDEQGNIANYAMSSYTIPFSGDDDDDDVAIGPVPGNKGLLEFTNITRSSVCVNWTMATDNVTSQENITYQLYKSGLNNIENYGQAKKNSELVFDWTAGKNFHTVSNLTANTTYFFNVMVADEHGNISNYIMAEVTIGIPTVSTITKRSDS